MNPINSYTSWQPLEEVIVGRAYSPDYFDFIENAQVRNQLQQILLETEEDLVNLQKTIEKFGARVRRPDLPDRDRFINQSSVRTRGTTTTTNTKRLADYTRRQVVACVGHTGTRFIVRRIQSSGRHSDQSTWPHWLGQELHTKWCQCQLYCACGS